MLWKGQRRMLFRNLKPPWETAVASKKWCMQYIGGITIINHPFGNGLYQLSMVIWGILDYCYTVIPTLYCGDICEHGIWRQVPLARCTEITEYGPWPVDLWLSSSVANMGIAQRTGRKLEKLLDGWAPHLLSSYQGICREYDNPTSYP